MKPCSVIVRRFFFLPATQCILQTEALPSYVIKVPKLHPSLFGQIVKRSKQRFVSLAFLLFDKTCMNKLQVHRYEKEERVS